MKNLYFVLLALLILPFTIHAQISHQSAAALKHQLNEVPAPRTNTEHAYNQRELIWSEDFQNGFDSDNGTWSVAGDDGALWTYTDSVAAGCWSGSGEAAVNFTTRDNGFMIFHPDDVNCINPDADPPLHDAEVYQGELISPSIDLSEASALLVTFEQRFRYCCSDEFEVWFSVSTDDGNSWTDYDVTDNTPVNSYNEEVPTSINISQIAGNESDVKFKFTWNATGTASHYFWAIDDILVEIPVDNDVALVDLNYQQFDPNTAFDYTDVKHTIYHVSQIRPLNLQGFAVNNGAVDQSDVVMHVTITTPMEVINLSAPAQNIAVADTGIFEIPYTPDPELGEYQLAYEIEIGTDDEIPLDNKDTLYFEVDDNYLARDERSRSGGFTNYEDDLRTGLGFTLTEDATIYGIALGLDNTSDVGTFFFAELLDMDFNFLAETEFSNVEESMMNEPGEENFVQLVLENPYSAVEGESFFPAFVHLGGEEVVNIALSGECPDFTCYVWAFIESDGQECNPCYYNSVPMIRLLFAENVSLQDVDPIDGVTLGQNVPNPAINYTTIVYELDKHASDVRLEVRNATGQVIYIEKSGSQHAGKYTEIIHTDNWSPGIYFYSLITDGKKQTERMAVVR